MLKKSYPIIITAVITCVVTAMLTFVFTTAYNASTSENMKLRIIEGYLDSMYYGEYNREQAMENAYKGYVASLGDPYTEYFTAEDYESFNSYIDSAYCGIGVAVQNETEKNVILVINVFDNSPAKDAGIEAGDIIKKVEGKEYTGAQLDDAVNAIKGEEGTEVKVTVLKASTGKEEEFTVKRQNVVMDTVEAEIIDGNIGYIYISQFGNNTADEFANKLEELTSKNIKGLIVDVRDNPGGTTVAVEAVAGCLLPRDAVIYYTSDKSDNKEYIKSKMDGIDIPLVVLANENSASAAEILVGAVKDNSRGTIVGTKTFGKGVVQSLIDLEDGTALKITVERYYTPNGNFIHGKGIEPDYYVESGKETDTQLEKAISILKNQ